MKFKIYSAATVLLAVLCFIFSCVDPNPVTPTVVSCEAEQKRLATDGRVYAAYFHNFNPIENGFPMSDLEQQISTAVQKISYNGSSTAVDAANSAASEGIISQQAASVFTSFYNRLYNQIVSTSGEGNSLVGFLQSEQSSLENSSNSCKDKEFTVAFITSLLGGLDHNINLFVEDNKSSFLRNGWCKGAIILYYTGSGVTTGLKIGALLGPKGAAAGGIIGGIVGAITGIFSSKKTCSSGSSGGGCQLPVDFYITPDPSNCERGTVKLRGSNSISLFDWRNTGGTPAQAFTTVPELVITQASRNAPVVSRIESFCSSNSQLLGINGFGPYNVSRSGIFSVLGIVGESSPQLTTREIYSYSIPTAGNQSLSVQWSLSGNIGRVASSGGTQANIVFRQRGTGVLKAILTSCDGSQREIELGIEVQ